MLSLSTQSDRRVTSDMVNNNAVYGSSLLLAHMFQHVRLEVSCLLNPLMRTVVDPVWDLIIYAVVCSMDTDEMKQMLRNESSFSETFILLLAFVLTSHLSE